MTGMATSRSFPPQALLLSLLAMAVPVVSAFNAPSWMEGDVEILMWLWALVPAFLLTYYKGWRGVSLALALGMAVLAMTQVMLLLLGAPSPNWRLLLGVVVAFVGVSLGLGYFAEILSRERARAEAQALVDPLTGLPNRRHVAIFLDAAFSAAARGTPLSVVMFDLDHFKAFNDNHGHPAGDQILRVFAKLLQDSSRRMDLAARYGGEEFLSILPECDLDEARGFARRILEDIRRTDLSWGRVTASAGIASYQEGMGTPDLLVAAADQALYHAKDEGRDRAVTWKPPAAVAEVEGREPSVPAARRRTRRPAIWVVDDDEEVGNGVGRILGELGYDTRIFVSPLKALAELEGSDRDPALLLVDVVMPEMNGLTLVERASKLCSGVPVIYMSGYIRGEVSWPGVPGARTAFLQKPMDVAELRSAVEEALAPSSGAELRALAGSQDGEGGGREKTSRP